MDLSKVNELLKATNDLAQLQQQVNVASSAPAAPPASTSVTPANSQLFAQLGAVLASASSQTPSTQAPARTQMLKQAAVVSSKTRSLMDKADGLEEMLNLSPTPDYVGAEELFGQFREILGNLEKEMGALQKQVKEQAKSNEMTLEQKPTAMKPGETVGDLSFNTTFSVQ